MAEGPTSPDDLALFSSSSTVHRYKTVYCFKPPDCRWKSVLWVVGGSHEGGGRGVVVTLPLYDGSWLAGLTASTSN